MSLSAPTRRLPIRCLYAPPIKTPIRSPQRRNASSDSKADNPSPNPILDEYKQKNPEQKPTPMGPQDMAEGMYVPGDLSNSSIFEDERRMQVQRERESSDGTNRVGGKVRDPKNMARVLDPDPKNRERWERKQVIKMVRKGGRLSRDEFIKRTEREHLIKSPNLKTSVKKLGMLARQIAGKTVDDAIVQMRFSKKRVAQEILKQLEHARDEAVVMRGMGLGQITPSNLTSTDEAPPKDRPISIQLKDGKRYKVTDRSKIYIDQAWVGRGPYGQLPDYRARGQMNIMRTPWTSLSLVLKEEATRVREFEEREAKRQRALKEKLWVAMPDRPIPIQRQWYSW